MQLVTIGSASLLNKLVELSDTFREVLELLKGKLTYFLSSYLFDF